MRLVVFLFLALFSLPMGVYAMDDDLDSALAGFSDDTDTLYHASETKEESVIVPSGTLTFGTAYGYADKTKGNRKTDFNGLTRLSSELFLALEGQPSKKFRFLIESRLYQDAVYDIEGSENFERDLVDDSQDEVEFREAYIAGRLSDNFDYKIGRQVVIWGTSDSIRVVDVLNPLDNREPGMVDFEDLRLPVFMGRLDFYSGNWNSSFIFITEKRFDRIPPFGSRYYPFPFPFPLEEHPSGEEFAFSSKGVFNSFDISFHFARYFERSAHPAMISGNSHSINGIDITNTKRVHSLITMVGVATNVAIGNWLIKAEAAHLGGIGYFALSQSETKSRADFLVGVDYSGFTDSIVSLEVALRKIIGFDSRLENLIDDKNEQEFEFAGRYTKNIFNDTLHITFLRLMFGERGQLGGVTRIEASYDVVDAFTVKIGVIAYDPGGKVFLDAIADKDQLFASAKYSF